MWYYLEPGRDPFSNQREERHDHNRKDELGYGKKKKYRLPYKATSLFSQVDFLQFHCLVKVTIKDE